MLATYFVNFSELNDHLFGKELFIRFTASAFRKLLSVYAFSYFPFGFEGRMWDLIVLVPDHCSSFYFKLDCWTAFNFFYILLLSRLDLIKISDRNSRKILFSMLWVNFSNSKKSARAPMQWFLTKCFVHIIKHNYVLFLYFNIKLLSVLYIFFYEHYLMWQVLRRGKLVHQCIATLV